MAETATCPCCGRQYEPASVRSKTCGRERCVAEWRNAARYHDPDARMAHYRAKARQVLKYPENYGPRRIEWAHQMLTDTPPKIYPRTKKITKKGGK